MNSVCAILGEVLSMGVLFRLTANMSEKSSFGLAGGIGVFKAVVVYMTVQDRRQQPNDEQEVI